MTAIVGFTKDGIVYMAGDTLGSSEYTESKVFKNGEFLIGYTSSFRFGQILEYEFCPPNRLEGLKDKEYIVKYFIKELRKCLEENKYTSQDSKGESGICLLGYRGNLYKIQSDFSILQSAYGYDACGSGDLICLDALGILKDLDISPKDKVIKAIEIASLHNPYVGGRITYIKSKKKKKEMNK